MKKALLIIMSAFLIFSLACCTIYAGEDNEIGKGYILSEAFYVSTAKNIAAEVAERITEYNIAEVFTESTDVIELVNAMGAEMSEPWDEIMMFQYDPNGITNDLWGVIRDKAEIDEELSMELKAYTYSGALLISMVQKNAKTVELAAMSIVNEAVLSKEFLTDNTDAETLVFLINHSNSYIFMVSFVNNGKNVTSVDMYPLTDKQQNDIVNYLEAAGCEAQNIEKDKEEAAGEIDIKVNELTDEFLLTLANDAAEHLIRLHNNEEFMNLVGVSDSLMDLCVIINADIQRELEVPAIYKIDGESVWESMLQSEGYYDEEALAEEDVKVIEIMKTMPVLESLAGAYIGSVGGSESLALSSLINVNDVVAVNGKLDKEVAIVYPCGDNYQILVMINASGENTISIIAEVVPASFEDMLKQISEQ